MPSSNESMVLQMWKRGFGLSEKGLTVQSQLSGEGLILRKDLSADSDLLIRGRGYSHCAVTLEQMTALFSLLSR
jgi:hypothetical protein